MRSQNYRSQPPPTDSTDEPFLFLLGLWGCGQRACVVHMSTGLLRLQKLARCEIIQRLVRAFIVVEAEPRTDADFGFRNVAGGAEPYRIRRHIFWIEKGPV